MAVNNRFKKAVDTATENTQENITQDAIDNTKTTISKTTKKKATNNTEESMIDNAEDNTLNTVIDSIQENILQNTSDNISYVVSDITNTNNVMLNAGSNILHKVLESNKKDRGNNHTLYLSAEVGEALSKIAKKAKKSKSTLVDEILRAVLIEQQ